MPDFRLTAKQEEAQELLNGPAQHVMLAGGSRSGKTVLCVRKILQRALKAPGSRHAILRFRFGHCIQSIVHGTYPWVRKNCFPQIPYAPKEVNHSLWYATLPGGSEVWFGGLDDKERVEKILGNEYCLHPDSRMLMADLTWRRAQDVSKGDEIIAFPEDLEGHMKLVRAMVQYNDPLQKKRYRIITTKGETIVSEGHKFVAYHDDRRVRNYRPLSWRTIEDLQPGDKIRFAIAPWPTDRSHDGGWLAGIFDGEGWCGTQVAMAQNPGPVLERAKTLLTERGISWRLHSAGKCHHICMRDMWHAMKLIGSVRPTRLLEKASKLWEGRNGFNGRNAAAGRYADISTDSKHVAEILSIERIEDGEVRAIQTSSKTLIADGFLGHNCSIMLNECSQIPYASRNMAVTRLAQKVEDRATGKPLRLKMYYDENPPDKGHWSYKLFKTHQDPDSKQYLPDPENYAFMQLNPRDNVENLPPEYLKTLESLPPRLRKRFLEGEFRDAAPNALFSDEVLERWRLIDQELPEMLRINVAVDPSGADDEGNADNDEIGIVVGGLGIDGKGYVLADLTCKAGPGTWGRVAVQAYQRESADRIVGEVNYGGAMVGHVIRTASHEFKTRVPFRAVTASRGKVVRAEPISALFETGDIRLAGYFPELEDELTGFTTYGYTGDHSPNRADALIWSMTDLFPDLIKHEDEIKKPSAPQFIHRPSRTGWMRT